MGVSKPRLMGDRWGLTENVLASDGTRNDENSGYLVRCTVYKKWGLASEWMLLHWHREDVKDVTLICSSSSSSSSVVCSVACQMMLVLKWSVLMTDSCCCCCCWMHCECSVQGSVLLLLVDALWVFCAGLWWHWEQCTQGSCVLSRCCLPRCWRRTPATPGTAQH